MLTDAPEPACTKQSGRMLKEQHALAVSWVECAASFKPAVMRTNLLPLESLPSPAASILALHQAPISWTRRNGAAVGQLMLAALLALGTEQAPTRGAASTKSPSTSVKESTVIQTVGAQRVVGDLQSEEFPTRWGFAEPSYGSEVAGLQQTIDEQSQHIKTLEAAVEALRALVCIACGIVVVLL